MAKVYLWDANELLYEFRLRETDYITEIVNTEYCPPLGAILVGVTSSDADGNTVEALGRVKSVTAVSQGRRRIRIEPVLALEAVSVEDLLRKVDPKVVARFERAGTPMELRPVRLPPTAADAVIAALSEDQDVSDWLTSLEEEATTLSEDRRQELQESRDAIGLALEIARLPNVDSGVLAGSLGTAVPDDVIAAVVKQSHLADTEEDLLPEDLRRFEEDTDVSMVSGHVARFRGGDYQLLVFNVNKKPFEVALGVDLIYWDILRNIFTLVQYKRLDRESASTGPTDWVYKNESEIRRQLALMVAPVSDVKTSADWRMTAPYWFKFVRRDAARFQDAKLLKGMYVPADYLRLALEDESLRTGPAGGFRVTYDNVKRVTRGTFSELVRRGLIGTAGVQSVDLKQVIGDLSSSGRSAIVAVKSQWHDPTEVQAPADLNDLLPRNPFGDPAGTATSFDDLLADMNGV